MHGVPGAPIPGVNRMVTIFIYLNDVKRGGRTRWRWLQHDAGRRGSRDDFYERPGPGSGRTDVERGAGPEVSVAPEEGLAVVHFPSTTASSGGFTDYNACGLSAEITRDLPSSSPHVHTLQLAALN